MQEDPGVEIALENVLETDNQWLVDIVKAVDHPNFRMCMDVGHASAYLKIHLMTWLEACAPWIGHIHVNNNDGRENLHRGLQDGNIHMKEILSKIAVLCPDATVTLEMTEIKPSLDWLKKSESGAFDNPKENTSGLVPEGFVVFRIIPPGGISIKIYQKNIPPPGLCALSG